MSGPDLRKNADDTLDRCGSCFSRSPFRSARRRQFSSQEARAQNAHFYIVKGAIMKIGIIGAGKIS